MKRLLCLLLIVTSVIPSVVEGQNAKIDSLLALLKTDKEDTNKAKHLLNLCRENRLIGDYDRGLTFGNQSLELAQTLNLKKVVAQAYNNIGVIYMNKGSYPEALKSYFASLKISEEINDKINLGNVYNNIGITCQEQGKLPEALKNYFASLKIREEIKDKKGIANSYDNIGIIYYDQGNLPEALKNYFACLKISEEIKDKIGIAASYNNLGNIYAQQGNYPEALKNYYASLKIKEEIKDKQIVRTPEESRQNAERWMKKINSSWAKEAEANTELFQTVSKYFEDKYGIIVSKTTMVQHANQEK